MAIDCSRLVESPGKASGRRSQQILEPRVLAGTAQDVSFNSRCSPNMSYCISHPRQHIFDGVAG